MDSLGFVMLNRKINNKETPTPKQVEELFYIIYGNGLLKKSQSKNEYQSHTEVYTECVCSNNPATLPK